MHPPRMSAPSCIVPPTEQLVIRPHIVPLLPTFHGMESENPYVHIKEFEDVCNTFQEGGTTIELMRLSKAMVDSKTHYSQVEQTLLALRIVTKKLCLYFQAH